MQQAGGRRTKGKPKRKKGRDMPERDTPRYLVNTGVIYQQLPRLLELTRERLLCRDYRSAAQCMSVVFRVHRLDNDTIFKCMAQLLSTPSPTTTTTTTPTTTGTVSAASIYVDMVRLYRRMRVVRVAQPLSFPAVETKNASQLRLELSVLLQRQGKVREAVEEMGKALDEGGLAGVGLMEGWTGVLGCLLAEEAAQRMAEEEQERRRPATGQNADEEREVKADDAEDEDELPISLSMSMFVNSQRSYATAPASASASLLSTHLASLSQHKVAAIKHLTTALNSQPDSSTWLYYLLDIHCNLNPSTTSSALALRIAHHFTTTNPLHPIGWRLKLLLLLRHYERMGAAVRWAGRRVLELDVCCVEGLRVVVWEWRAGRVTSDEVVGWLLRRLDIDGGGSGSGGSGEGQEIWEWLHEALHGLVDRQVGSDGDGWWCVSEEAAEAAVADSGGEGEWEIEKELLELRATEEEEAEEARSQQLSQQFETDLRLGSGGHGKRRDDTVLRKRDTDDATPTTAILSATSTAPSLVASVSAALPSLPVGGGGVVSVVEELQQRLEWWVLSLSHMRDVEALSGADGACGVDRSEQGSDALHGLRGCCLGLMRALVQL